MPAYYSADPEKPLVYHSTTSCHEYADIEAEHLRRVAELATRHLCEVCAGLEAAKAKQ